MIQPVHLSKSRRLEQLASDLRNLAFDVAEPSRWTRRSDRMTAEGKRIAGAVREKVASMDR